MNKNQGFGLTALFLIVVAYAFTGAAAPVGIHAECTDGIDNDTDAAIDVMDQDCIDYPFADGNGESPTPIDDRFGAPGGYTSTAYDWWYQELLAGTYTDDPCLLNAAEWHAPGNDGSGSQYDAFSIQYCI
jgi:hypothetical protein